MEDVLASIKMGQGLAAQHMRYFDGKQKIVYPTQKLHNFRPGVILVSRTDEKGIITHANRAFVEVSGYSKEELVGSAHHIVRHPDLPKSIFKDMWQTIQSGEEWHGYVKNLRKNGDHYWVYATVVPIIRNTKIIGYTSVRRTIDAETIRRCEEAYAGLQRKATGTSLPGDSKIIADMPSTDPQAVSKELHYFHKQKRTVYITGKRHNIRSGVILMTQTDLEGVITKANRSFIDISGYSEDELIGMPHCIMRHPDMPARVYKNMWETISKGKEWRGYIKNLRKDGKFYWVYATVDPVFKNGKITSYSSVRRTVGADKSDLYEERYRTMRDQELNN